MSLSSLESTGGPSGVTHLGKHISFGSAKSGSSTGTVAGGSDLFLSVQLSAYNSTLPLLTLCPLALSNGVRGGGEAQFRGCFFSFPLEILAVKPRRLTVRGHITVVAPSSAYSSSACFSRWGLRALSHLPCHDSSVNHLEPSFARQGSMGLTVHHNVELVISAS